MNDRLKVWLNVYSSSTSESFFTRKSRLTEQEATALDSHPTPPCLWIQWQVCAGYHIAAPDLWQRDEDGLSADTGAEYRRCQWSDSKWPEVYLLRNTHKKLPQIRETGQQQRTLTVYTELATVNLPIKHVIAFWIMVSLVIFFLKSMKSLLWWHLEVRKHMTGFDILKPMVAVRKPNKFLSLQYFLLKLDPPSHLQFSKQNKF